MSAKKIIVQKYGGSSVATPKLVKNVARRICGLRKDGYEVVVVVSAMGKTTDELTRLAHDISTNPAKREMDMLLSVGERISMSLLSMAINDLGYPAISFTGSQSGIITDDSHTDAKIVAINCYRIREELEKGKIVIVAGFQGCSTKKEITTLGRGGSDTTAVALAIELGAEKCQILKDVEGVYSADPKIVGTTLKLAECSYDEMLEMSWLGAKVLHPRSVELAKKYGMPVEVCSSFIYRGGTVIRRNEVEQSLVTAVTYDRNICRITLVYRDDTFRLSELFKKLGDDNISCKFIVKSSLGSNKSSVTFAVATRDYAQALAAVNNIPDAQISHSEDICAVSVIGHGLSVTPNIAAVMFEVLESNGVEVIFTTSSNLTRTFIVPASKTDNAVSLLHNAFVERGLLKGEKC